MSLFFHLKSHQNSRLRQAASVQSKGMEKAASQGGFILCPYPFHVSLLPWISLLNTSHTLFIYIIILTIYCSCINLIWFPFFIFIYIYIYIWSFDFHAFRCCFCWILCWILLSWYQEQSYAACVGYRKDLWNAAWPSFCSNRLYKLYKLYVL